MRVHVRYFAILRDVQGREDEEIELPPGATVGQLLGKFGERLTGPSHGLVGSIAVAVNQVYSTADVVLREGDEVAFLPPVSGGFR